MCCTNWRDNKDIAMAAPPLNLEAAIQEVENQIEANLQAANRQAAILSYTNCKTAVSTYELIRLHCNNSNDIVNAETRVYLEKEKLDTEKTALLGYLTAAEIQGLDATVIVLWNCATQGCEFCPTG